MEELGRMTDVELGVKVSARLKLVKEITDFAEEITRKLGKLIKIDHGDRYTHIAWRLDGFRNFTFLVDICQNPGGGNFVYLWHHPYTEKIIARHVDSTFSVYYKYSVNVESEVRSFDPKPEWLQDLRVLIRNKDLIIFFEEKRREEEALKQVKDKGLNQREALIKRARDLKI